MRSNELHFDNLGIFAVMARALTLPPGEPDAFPRASSIRASEPKRGLIERLDRWLWEREQRAVEAYLAQSSDIHDLEVRMRNLERGAHRGFH